MSIRPTTWTRPFAMSLPYGVYPSRQFFHQETPPVEPPVVPPVAPPGDPELGDKGKAALDAERQARRDEEKARKAAEKELADLKAADQKRRDDETASQGQFQKLAEDRKVEIDTLTTARDGLQERVTALEAEVQGYRDAAEADYQTAVKALPDELRDLAPEGDLATRRAWLAKAQKAGEKVTKRTERGNPPNPRADGPPGERDAADAAELARRRYGLPAAR